MRFTPYASARIVACVILWGAVGGQADTAPADAGKTLGYTIVTRHHSTHETPGGKKECPHGMQSSVMDNYYAKYPAGPIRDEQARKYGVFHNIGPNGENGNHMPLAVEDPLPFREAEGDTSYGMNLDGTTDGRETSHTCKHQKFASSPDGDAAIDNQLYRVIGCSAGYRTSGMQRVTIGEQESTDRMLMEITGVVDERNSPDVTVTFYKGIEPIRRDGAGKPIPYLTQHIDTSGYSSPEFTFRTKGRISDGVLITDPIDKAVLYGGGRLTLTQVKAHDLRLRLKLTEEGATGHMAGYVDVASWWRAATRHAQAYPSVSNVSGPSLYRALLRNADGRRDAATGQCTAISTDYSVEMVRASLVHPKNNARQIAQGRTEAPGSKN